MFILAMAFFMVGMVACDIIEEPYFKGGNSGGGDETEEIAIKNILLEDYTGVRCNNCPVAGELALQLQEQYGHRVIVLSVHAGFLSQPIGGYPNFMTPEGTEWYSQFGFDSNPIGTVNRKLNGGSYGYQSSEWGEAIAETFQEGSAAFIMVPSVKYDETTRNLEVEISSKAMVELPDAYNLTVCIMEDSIVGRQLTHAGNVEDYIHRHVFRTTMNGTWGEEINTTAIAPGEELSYVYAKKLDKAFNEDQCYIVAYISNRDTKEILQVTEQKIK